MTTKKGKGKRRGGNKGKASPVEKDPSSSSSALDDGHDDRRPRSFWSVDDECAHYASLGCHIANVARCFVDAPSSECASAHDESSRRAMKRHKWLLGIERFDPNEYDPEDIAEMPEVAMDDDGMTLSLTNVDECATSICYITVYDVDLLGGNGDVLRKGNTSTTTTTRRRSTGGHDDGLQVTMEERECTTFVVSCPPRTFVHLCTLAPCQRRRSRGGEEESTTAIISSWTDIEIESDVHPISVHPHPEDEHTRTMHFPFRSVDDINDDDDDGIDRGNERNIPPSPGGFGRRYRCTQSENGELTHFFRGNRHAIDFACPIGTPLYSPVDGTIVDVRDRGGMPTSTTTNATTSVDTNEEENVVVEVSGIAASNMFRWNSIMIRANDDDVGGGDGIKYGGGSPCGDGNTGSSRGGPLFVEFVHIRTNSCVVRVGDDVRIGQLLCHSGSVGFSPEPHLHMSAYRTDGDDAATVRVRFQRMSTSRCDAAIEEGAAGDDPLSTFLPRAGGWYDCDGLVR